MTKHAAIPDIITETITPDTTHHRMLNKEDSVYLGMRLPRAIVMEDDKNHILYPEEYEEIVDSILGKYIKAHEKEDRFIISEYSKGFEKLTDFKLGDKMYISTIKEVTEAYIKNYYFDNEFYALGGTALYPAFNVHIDYLKGLDVFVCSKNPDISQINEDFIDRVENQELFKKIIHESLKIIKIMKVEGDSAKIINPITEIDSGEIKIIKGSFTKKDADEFIVNYQKGSMYPPDESGYYSSFICIMNENLKPLRYFVKPAFRNYYTKLIGIVDVNGDGLYEIIEKSGFWDGSSYSIKKFKGDSTETIANAFGWGA